MTAAQPSEAGEPGPGRRHPDRPADTARRIRSKPARRARRAEGGSRQDPARTCPDHGALDSQPVTICSAARRAAAFPNGTARRITVSRDPSLPPPDGVRRPGSPPRPRSSRSSTPTPNVCVAVSPPGSSAVNRHRSPSHALAASASARPRRPAPAPRPCPRTRRRRPACYRRHRRFSKTLTSSRLPEGGRTIVDLDKDILNAAKAPAARERTPVEQLAPPYSLHVSQHTELHVRQQSMSEPVLRHIAHFT